VALLVGLEDFSRWLPRLREKRAQVQATRRVTDDEILPLLPEPLKLHDLGDRYRDTAAALIRDFRVAELFGLPSPPAQVTVPASVSPWPNAPLAADSQRSSRSAPAGSGPRVSVVVLTASGATHLPDCLDSPARRGRSRRIIVVDNDGERSPRRRAPLPGTGPYGRNPVSRRQQRGRTCGTGDYIVF
jgi:hypothetical protein